MSNSDNYSLRPEAGPVPYWKHHKRAKEALNLIIRVLNAAAKSVGTGKAAVKDPTIDTNRSSRIFFVSGEPGSGKSTLYLTLKAMLNSREEERAEFQLGYNAEKVRVNINDKLQGVRWLDALDLEVAGDEGENLLAAVLVRLFRKLEEEESGSVNSKDCEDAVKELEELATDIGIAWEGNLQARAGNLDPDTYSAEVIRTQGARLRINERLKGALNKLAEKECYGCKPGTLFVLPVDDFYLKPDASLQLLRLLRMISIPRLFFLVMGDINTVEALFIEKSLADWTGVAGTQLFAKQEERLDEALTRARELRARYLRKLLPPAQRAIIEAMDWHEALNFEVRRPETRADDAEILGELLAEVTLDQPLQKSANEPPSLLAFLISPSLPHTYLSKEAKLERKKKAKGENAKEETQEEKDIIKLRSAYTAYTALQILDATPREMMDLGSELREVIRKTQEFRHEGNVTSDTDKTPELLSRVRDMVNLVREEQNFLNEKAQKVLEGILPTRHYYPEDINFEMDRLCLQPTRRTWISHKSEQLRVRGHRSWDLMVNSKYINNSDDKSTGATEAEGLEQTTKDPFAKLPPRPAAWFILLHDLAWVWNPSSVIGNLVEGLCQELNEFKSTPTELARQHKSITDIGWAAWSDNGIFKHFPMPEFKTFRDLDRFLHVWSRGLEWLVKPENEEIDRIIDIWALAAWTILVDGYGNFAKDSNKWYEDFKATTGTSYKERFKKFRKKLTASPDKDAQIEKWLIRKWLKKLSKTDDWPKK